MDYRNRLQKFVWKYWFEFILLAVGLMIVLFSVSSCGGGSHPVSTPPKEGVQKVLAVYVARDSLKKLDALIMNITKSIKYDSFKKKDEIVVDTAWYFPTILKVKDSVGNVVKDKYGRDSLSPTPVYFPIRRDSVRWFEPIPIDSLLKK